MRNLKVDAIILKRSNVGEADRILTVFTRQFGKMSIKASGVRKIASKRASHIELLNRVHMGLYKGHGMHVLTEAISIESFPSIKEDLTKVGFAYHICELIDGLCPEGQENEEIFTLLLDLLSKLAVEKDMLDVIHEFEIELLTILGYYSHGTYDLSGAKASYFIESILERRLKSRQILQKLL